MRLLAQRAAIALVRPYVAAELPGWGRIYSALVGTYKRDAFWRGSRRRTGRNKLFGYETDYDLQLWSDRQAFFLGRWYDLPTQLLLRAVGGGLIVDVGANRGEFSLAAASMHPRAKVIAFEPNPAIAAVLLRDIARNGFPNIEVRQCGLGDVAVELPLHVPLGESGGSSLGGNGGAGFVTKQIPVRVGDDELEGLKPSLIKIDVEGYELRVLKGLRRTIERARPIIETELLPETLERCGTSADEVKRYMASLGYRGFGLGLKRKGRHNALQLVELGTTWDAVWIPEEWKAEGLQASTADLLSRCTGCGRTTRTGRLCGPCAIVAHRFTTPSQKHPPHSPPEAAEGPSSQA